MLLCSGLLWSVVIMSTLDVSSKAFCTDCLRLAEGRETVNG